MKHAKRMVLVPEDALQRYKQRQRLGTSPIMASIMREDTDMSNILQRTDLGDDEKQKLYYANLERYLDLWRQKDRPTLASPVVVRRSYLMCPLSIYLERIVIEPQHFWID